MKSSKAFQKVEGVPNLYHRGTQFYARLSINGKQTWRSLDTKSIREAKKALAELQTGRTTEVKKRSEPSLHAAMEETIAFRAIRRGISRPLSAATLSYHAEILTLAKKMLPDKRLSSLTESEILSIIGGATVGQSRRKAVFELVKGTFQRARDNRQTVANPLAGHVPGQVPPKDRELPTREQLDEIIAVVKDESPKWGRKAGLSIRFFAFSGMRRSEALAVEWSDIGAKEIHIKGTKTARSDRRLQINPPLQETLDEIAEVYGREGRVIPLKCVRAHLKKACEKLELRKLTNHDLRSWFATYSLQQGVDVPTVADWLGDSAEVVLRRYTAIMTDHKHTAAQLLK